LRKEIKMYESEECKTCKGKTNCELEAFQDCQYNRANWETVGVIASGYEWICPHPDCGRLQRIIEMPANMESVCSDCGERVNLSYPEHAYG